MIFADETGKKYNYQIVKMLKSEVYYTCPMHPDVKSDKPGKCPKCGMELIKKEKDLSDTSKTIPNADTIQIK